MPPLTRFMGLTSDTSPEQGSGRGRHLAFSRQNPVRQRSDVTIRTRPRVPGSGAGLVRAGDALDLAPSVLPRALHDPGHRTLQALRLFLDLLEHRLGEIKALL